MIGLYLLHRWLHTVLLPEELVHVLANISLVRVHLNKSLILDQLKESSAVGRVMERINKDSATFLELFHWQLIARIFVYLVKKTVFIM